MPFLWLLIVTMFVTSSAIARDVPSKVEAEIHDEEQLPEVQLTDPMNRDVNPAMPDRTGTSTDTIGLGPPALRTAQPRPTTSDPDAKEASTWSSTQRP
jgi:hypothetical protein